MSDCVHWVVIGVVKVVVYAWDWLTLVPYYFLQKPYEVMELSNRIKVSIIMFAVILCIYLFFAVEFFFAECVFNDTTAVDNCIV